MEPVIMIFVEYDRMAEHAEDSFIVIDDGYG